MKAVLKTVLPILLCMTGVARADVTEIAKLADGSTVFSTYFANPKKISSAQAMSQLKALIAPLGLTPCLLRGDRGAAVICGDGVVTISASNAYSYPFNNSFPTVINELQSLDPVVYKRARMPDGVEQVWSVNFLPPPANGAACPSCDIPGAVSFTFSQPVKQFAVQIDTSDAQLTLTLTNRVRITINGKSIEKDLALGVNQISVADIDPVTGLQLDFGDVKIEPLSGFDLAFSMDKYGYSIAQ